MCHALVSSLSSTNKLLDTGMDTILTQHLQRKQAVLQIRNLYQLINLFSNDFMPSRALY